PAPSCTTGRFPERMFQVASTGSNQSRDQSVLSRGHTRDSMRPRTARASCRSGSPSMNCTTVINASRKARLDRAPILRKYVGKGLVLIHRSQSLAHFHGEIAFRIGCTSHTGRFIWDGELTLRVECH